MLLLVSVAVAMAAQPTGLPVLSHTKALLAGEQSSFCRTSCATERCLSCALCARVVCLSVAIPSAPAFLGGEAGWGGAAWVVCSALCCVVGVPYVLVVQLQLLSATSVPAGPSGGCIACVACSNVSLLLPRCLSEHALSHTVHAVA